MTDLLKALRKARREFPPIVKDQTNPFFKSKYAALDSILRSVTPTLDENELTLHAYFDDQDGRSILVMDLYHDSGEKMPTSRLWIRVKKTTKVDKDGVATITEDNPQDTGSGISYAVRYCIKTYLGLPLEDDDGNQASGRTQRPQQGQSRQPTTNEPQNDLGKLQTTVKDAEKAVLMESGKTMTVLRKELLGEGVALDMKDEAALKTYLALLTGDENESGGNEAASQ